MTPAAIKGEPLAILTQSCRRVEGQGKGDRFDPPRQLRDHPADRPAGRDRQAGVHYQELRDAFKKAGKKTSEVPKFGEFEKKSFAMQQPLRTDLERMLQEQKGFVDVEIEA